MVFVGVAALIISGGLLWFRLPRGGRAIAASLALLVAGSTSLLDGSAADAAIVPTVGLGTAGSFSVLAATTVTNTGPTIMSSDLGLSPGSSVTGFPPGTVTPPATQEIANAVAVQAQSDLTTAYNDAAGRPTDATTGAELGGQTLQGGVYAATVTKDPLLLDGTLTLDGANDPSSVFIFQTDSTITTGSDSVVRLINGASACNVFWQIGSSATLGTRTSFVGSILALTAITLNDAVTVNGRALARNAEVTLINDTFTGPDCTPSTSTTVEDTTTTTAAITTTTEAATTTTAAATTTTEAATTTTEAATTTTEAATTTLPLPGTATTLPGAATTLAAPGTTTTAPGATTTVSGGADVLLTTTTGGNGTVPMTTSITSLTRIPRTGKNIRVPLVASALTFDIGALALVLAATAERRRALVH